MIPAPCASCWVISVLGNIGMLNGHRFRRSAEYPGGIDATAEPKRPWRRASKPWTTELLQRCRSSVRTALAIDVMRLGLHRALRKIRQDFSLATPRSTGARAAASA